MSERRTCEATTRKGWSCSRPATSTFSIDAEFDGKKTVITMFYCTYHGVWWAEEHRRREYAEKLRVLGHPRVVAAFGAPSLSSGGRGAQTTPDNHATHPSEPPE